MSTLRRWIDPFSSFVATRDRDESVNPLDHVSRFSAYPKTSTGFVTFFQTELYRKNVLVIPDGFKVLMGVWIELSQVEFLRLLLTPLYHCAWEPDMIDVLKVLRSDHTNVSSVKLLADRLIPTGVKLEDVPDDWRDLVENMIRDNQLDLSKYKTVDDLERYVDSYLAEQPDTNVSPPLEPLRLGPAEVPLMEEEREIIARTLRLSPDEFKTKSEALALYEARGK